MKSILNTFWVIFTITVAEAATVSLTNVVDFDSTTNAIVDVNGTAISSSSGYAAAGSFSISDNDIINYTHLNDLVTAFTTVSEGNFNAGNGLYDIPDSSNSNIQSGSVYTVLGNGSTFANSTQIAILKHTLGLAADPNITATAVVSNSANGNIDSILIGEFNNFTYDFGAGENSAYNLVNVVPEPSTFILTAVGALALFRRRR